MNERTKNAASHSSYALGRSAKRKAARDRIHLQVLHPIDTPSLLRDPLSHPGSRLRGTFAMLKLLVVAAAVHGLIIAVLYVVSDFVGETTAVTKRDVVAVRVVEVVKPSPPPPEPVPTTPLVPDFGTEPPKNDTPKPPADKAPPAVRKPAKKEPQKPATEGQPDKPPPRYRPGISMESTTHGGKGPAMETGNTRMGKTATTASGPQKATPTSNGTSGGTGRIDGAAEGVRQQRKAQNIPGQGGVFVKPKRVAPGDAPYPKTLEAQGIEGDVKIRVTVSASGRVTDVSILESSGHQAFDRSARKAALAEKFRPATRDGKAVPFTLSYSYRFRIKEK